MRNWRRAILALALLCGISTPGWTQNPPHWVLEGHGGGLFLSEQQAVYVAACVIAAFRPYTITRSTTTRTDAGSLEQRPPTGQSKFAPQLMAEVGATADSDSSVLATGGMRILHRGNPKIHGFAQAQAGILRNDALNDFLFVPGGGVLIPLVGRRFDVIVGLDFPIDFSDGGTHVGAKFYGGITLPF